MPRLTVHSWPDQRNTALSTLAERSFVVIQIYAEHKTYQASSPKQQREHARASIRRAIQELLSHHFAIPVDQINIERQAGHMPGADLCIKNHRIHLSISHEHELSVAAIYIEKAHHAILRPLHKRLRERSLSLRCTLCTSTGPLLNSNFDRSRRLCSGLILGIGIDILKTPVTKTIADWQDVATLYLGPHISAAIAKLPHAEQAHKFAQQWTQLEATFKSQGIGLSEWSEASEIDKDCYQMHELDLAEGWCGVLVLSTT